MVTNLLFVIRNELTMLILKSIVSMHYLAAIRDLETKYDNASKVARRLEPTVASNSQRFLDKCQVQTIIVSVLTG